MNPAFSVVLFTAIAGAAQGLIVALAIAVLSGAQLTAGFVGNGLLLALVMLLAGLGASFAHLGRPERAWRAVLMWRTSWLSREVIALPVFIAITGLWWLLQRAGESTMLLPIAAIMMAFVLWYCTAMIYRCLRFIEEWAQPLTLANFTLIGLSSGLILASALAAWSGEVSFLRVSGLAAVAVTLLAWLTRVLSLRHNAGLVHRSTLQSATGIQSPRLVQRSMGMSAGSFNTREFFHHASLTAFRQIRLGFLLSCFLAPVLLALWGLFGGGTIAWTLALLIQIPGLLAERWFFFAQARHPQNLYYQFVS